MDWMFWINVTVLVVLAIFAWMGYVREKYLEQLITRLEEQRQVFQLLLDEMDAKKDR